MADGTIDIALLLEDDRFQNALSNSLKIAEQKSKSTFDKLGATFKGLGNVALAAGAAIAGAGVAIFKMGMEASDAEEVNSKFINTFRDLDEAIRNSAVDELRDKYGLAGDEARYLLATTGDLLGGFGMAEDAALKLSMETQRLAVDLASYNNIPVAEASDRITKGLLGERDGMKALGIVISEETLKAELLAQGKEKLTGEAMLQAKAEATLAVAMRQSSKAIGDYGRTSQGTANQFKLMQTRIGEIAGAIGGFFVESLGRAFSHIAKVAGQITDMIMTSETLGPALKNISDKIVDIAIAISDKLATWLPKVIEGFSWVLNNAGSLAFLIGGIGVAILGFSTASFVASGGIGTLTASVKAFTASLLSNPFGLLAAGVALVVTYAALAIKHFDTWGEKVNNIIRIVGGLVAVFAPPIGLIILGITTIIDFVGTLKRNWDAVTNAFTNGGIIKGLQQIFNVFLLTMLKPMDGLLSMIEKIPGVGKLASGALDKVDALQAKIQGALDSWKSPPPIELEADTNLAETAMDEFKNAAEEPIEITPSVTTPKSTGKTQKDKEDVDKLAELEKTYKAQQEIARQTIDDEKKLKEELLGIDKFYYSEKEKLLREEIEATLVANKEVSQSKYDELEATIEAQKEFVEKSLTVIDFFGQNVGALADNLGKFITTAFNATSESVSKLRDGIVGMGAGLVSSSFSILENGVMDVFDNLTTAWTNNADAGEALKNSVVAIASSLLQNLGGILLEAGGWFVLAGAKEIVAGNPLGYGLVAGGIALGAAGVLSQFLGKKIKQPKPEAPKKEQPIVTQNTAGGNSGVTTGGNTNNQTNTITNVINNTYNVPAMNMFDAERDRVKSLTQLKEVMS